SNHNSNLGAGPQLAVTANPKATVLAGPRIAAGPGVPVQLITPLVQPSGPFPSLALYVQAFSDGSAGDVGFNPSRAITWDSNVILTSGPSPTLMVDKNGDISEAINASVVGVGNMIGSPVDPTHTGGFTVDNINNTSHGQALFQTNGGDDGDFVK